MTRLFYIVVSGLLASAALAEAQLAPNLTYDGRPNLARIRYTPMSNPDACQNTDSPGGPGWGHDYPMSVQGLLTGAVAVTTLNSAADSNLVLTIEDPEIMKHPTAMLVEPGCWNPTEAEAVALRSYLLKGGFLIADDFTFFDCSFEHCTLAVERFETWIKRVIPGAKVMPLPASHPVFDGFFKVDPADAPGWSEAPAQISGLYLDNDPTKRLLVVANYWSTLGQYWRYVESGYGSGLERGGMAYKLGLNYLMYGLSH